MSVSQIFGFKSVEHGFRFVAGFHTLHPTLLLVKLCTNLLPPLIVDMFLSESEYIKIQVYKIQVQVYNSLDYNYKYPPAPVDNL